MLMVHFANGFSKPTSILLARNQRGLQHLKCAQGDELAPHKIFQKFYLDRIKTAGIAVDPGLLQKRCAPNYV